MKKTAFVIGLLIGFQALAGQGAKYIIRNYDLLNEINLNGSSWAMVQDTSGVLYFGADYGVAIYNGAYWDITSRNQSIVRSLYYDSSHRIVYGGFDDFGFLEQDISRGTVFKSLADQLPDSLKVFGDVWSICELGGKLFFQSKNLIFIEDNGNISAYRVNDCYHRGFVANGEYLVNQKGIGLTRFDGNSFIPMRGGEFFKGEVISCILESADKKVLIGCRNTGFFSFNPVTGSVDDAFPGNPQTNTELAKNRVYHGISLPDGNLAVATLSGGTYILGAGGSIHKVLNRNHGLRDNVNYSLGLSYDNNLWICTSNGISAFNINSPFILWDYTSGIDGVVLDILDYQDHVYIGTLTGLYGIAAGRDNQALLRAGASCLLNSEVWSLVKMEIGGVTRLFFGSGNGLYRLDQSKPVLINESELILKLIHLRSNPDILLALHADNLDVYRWNGTTFIFERKVGDQFNGMRTAGEDDRGNLWVGTRNAGVVRLSIAGLLNQASLTGADGHSSESLNSVSKYQPGPGLTDVIEYQGQVVFSNNQGLFSFNHATGSFEKCQLFGPEISSAQRMISTLKKDSRGNIWIGGEDILLARPDGTYTFDKLNFQQLKDVFSAFAFLHSSDQKSWIGGNNGVYLYDNRIRVSHSTHLQTIINRIEVLRDTTLFLNAASPDRMDPGFSSGKSLDMLDIDLAKRNSQVTFSFSLPFFENERSTVYSYKLDGYQEEWSPWSAETQVTFSNLRPSDYLFQVKGKTIYNQTGLPAAVRFNVPRPGYRSGFSLALYSIGMVLLIYLIARYLSRVSLRKHLRIEDIIRKRIQESNRSHILSLLNAYPGQLPEQAAISGLAGPHLSGSGQPETRENQFLSRALKIMEAQMGNHNLTAGQFCRELGMSQAKVYRKLISLTGMSINEFIRNIRLKKAAQLLIETDLPISEIAYATGFSSPGYFTKCFTGEFGQNPRDFSQKKHH
jgi:AraC-like DNA-binding protein